MTERDEMDFIRIASAERDMLLPAVYRRLADGAQPAALLHGLAAVLGECAAMSALPGRLDGLIEALAVTMRANAAQRMSRAANRPEHGHA